MLTRDAPPDTLDEMGVAGQVHEEGESSTAAIGRVAYEAATGGEEPEDKETQQALSYGVHWGYGVATAGLYGAVRGPVGWPDASGGLLFGTALWVLGDEFAVPLLGLAKGPTAFPLEQHAHRFGAHVAFGLATAATTQGIYKLSRGETSIGHLAWRALKGYARWKAIKASAKALARVVR